MASSKRFTRTIEDFTCEHCGAAVIGNGYTNHCPKCLWSKHVDRNPGDRLAACGGMMESVLAEKERSDYVITHRCAVCGFERRNKLQKGDDFDAFVAISKKSSERK
ncbi:MAG TPA: RNHCP domain-containing protein [Candidatus Paceibacterota bacterium]|nr:RNHCP domain-containing protein [Candidatus Paceibacterota bacterium]